MFLQEIEIKKFIKQNELEINAFFKIFQETFNEVGRKYNSNKMQASYTGLILAGILQSSNMSKIDAQNACNIALASLKPKN